MNNYIILYLSGIVPALVYAVLILTRNQRILRGVDLVLLIAIGLIWPVSMPFMVICFLEFENPFYKKEIENKQPNPKGNPYEQEDEIDYTIKTLKDRRN